MWMLHLVEAVGFTGETKRKSSSRRSAMLKSLLGLAVLVVIGLTII